ncbi:hypothetical protein, partial [Clostridium perfringens]|uniref:hypothetical protein n=2 Tax=Clostridiaceae TaxID=31979 RepID=UPI0013E32D0E
MNRISNFLEIFNYKKYTTEQKIKFILLSIMTLTLILVRTWTIASYWLIIPIIFNTILMGLGIIDEFEFIMYSMIMPSEIYNFLGIGIAILSWIYKITCGKVKFNFNKKDKWLGILIVFMLLSGFISCIVNSTILSAIFSLGYIFVMLFIFRITVACNYKIKDIS